MLRLSPGDGRRDATERLVCGPVRRHEGAAQRPGRRRQVPAGRHHLALREHAHPYDQPPSQAPQNTRQELRELQPFLDPESR